MLERNKNKMSFFTLMFVLIFYSHDNYAQHNNLSKPNIVVILADDFGVGDIQAHYPNNKIQTPYLDKLVQQGVSFTDAHSGSAVCTPSRYGLLTGRYAWRTQLQEWVLGCYEPPLIDKNRLTLPKYLQNNGYKTACIGKWHLGLDWAGEEINRKVEGFNSLKGKEWDFTKPFKGGPNEVGFDYYFGVDVPNFPPFTFVENNHVVVQPTANYKYDPSEGVVMPKEFDGHPMAPNWKFNRILPKITETAVDYIHKQAKKENPFFLYFSMTSPHEPVVTNEEFAGKSGIAPIADFIMETDAAVGKVIKAIKDAGISDNTLIIFTADNGHSHYTGWDELLEAGHLPSGPYRGYKGDIWEGGHRVPFIVKWQGKIAEGTTNNQMVVLEDIFSTCAELINGELLPNNVGEDSFSFLDELIPNKTTSEIRKNMISHSVKGEFAYRSGKWKIIFKLPENGHDDLTNSRGKKSVVHLYNMEEDIAETNNVVKQYPAVVKKLTNELRLVVKRGTSRQGDAQKNDVDVDFESVQKERWANLIVHH